MEQDGEYDVERQLRDLRGSWEYAFAHAHGCTWGTDPRLQWVHEREAELIARLSAR